VPWVVLFKDLRYLHNVLKFQIEIPGKEKLEK
jgi:hypothetical protein